MDNKIVSIVCCAIVLILLVIENMKTNKDTKPSDIVQYSLPEEVEEPPQFDPPVNHPIVIPDYIKNIVKENALSCDVKPILKKYESPPYFNPLTDKGVIRDVDEIITQTNLTLH
jgi:hypothetical protein